MSEFLRALSPTRAHDATRAVPLLPSTFETLQPVRVRRSGSPADVETLAPPQPPSVRASESTDPGDRYERDAHAPSHHGIAPRVDTRSQHEPRTNARSLPATTDRAPRDPLVERGRHARAQTSRPAVEPASTPLRRPDASAHDARESNTSPVRTSTIEPITTQVLARTIAPAARAVKSPTMSAPLSQRALATRPSPAVDPRPVVHVTIDRVEVHAPITPATPKPPSRPRTTPPSVSLNDYLRGHDVEGRGGLS